MALGAEVSQLGEQAADKQNTLRAEDAFNTLRQKQQDLTIGEDGFAKKQGGDAVNQPLLKDYSAKFDQSVNDIASTLGNDAQRELFQRRAKVAGMQFQGDIINHVTKENDAYQKQVTAGTVATEVANATTRWADPNGVALSLERIDAAVNAQASREGWSDEYKNAQRLDAESKVHTSVVGQALANGNYQFAQKYFELNKDGMTLASQELVAKAVQDGTQKQLTNGYRSMFLDTRDDLNGLAALEKQVTKDPKLDDTRKNMLLGQIASRNDILERRINAQQKEKERVLGKAITDVNNNTLAGFEPTVDQMGPLITASRGTSLEGDVDRAVALAKATSQFRTMGPRQRSDEIANYEAQLRKNPDKLDRGVLTHLRTIDDAIKTQVKDNPIQFATAQGIRDPNDAAVQPLDLSKPDTLGPNLGARFALNRELMNTQGAPFKPLTPQETTALKTVVTKMDPGTKTAYFGSLAKAAGTDIDGYKAMMNQLAPDDPVMAAGGIAAMRGLISDKGRVVADSIFRGQAYLNPPKDKDGKPIGKEVPLPKEQDMASDFNSYAGTAFTGKPEARNIYFQSARAIYADKVVNAGNYTGVLDGSLWKESIALATGGIHSHNGQDVVLPYGTEYGDFKDGIKQRLSVIEAAGKLPEGVTVSDLRNLPLENEGDGRYILKSGDRKMLDRDGHTIILDFNKPPEQMVTRANPTTTVMNEFSETQGGGVTGVQRKRAPANQSQDGGFYSPVSDVKDANRKSGTPEFHQSNIDMLQKERDMWFKGRASNRTATLKVLDDELAAERALLEKSKSGSGGGGGGKYDTQLSPDKEADFQKQFPDAHDTQDYDMRGAFKAGIKPDERGHLPDTYKKPNHITFSDESVYSGKDGNKGGKWGKDGDTWTFTPGPTNLKYHSIKELKDYFEKYEPDARLILPGKSMLRRGAESFLDAVSGKANAASTVTKFQADYAAKAGVFDDVDKADAKRSKELQAQKFDNSGSGVKTGVTGGNREGLIKMLMDSRKLSRKQAEAVADGMLRARGGS